MNINRLGLGCMGMSIRRNADRSIQTIHEAIDKGITFLNTGNFYQCGESEMLLGHALKGIQREKYFLSVKFGLLFSPDGRMYGLDVHPFHIKAQLTYSLRRLGLEYIDLYQPSRMDESIPVEDIIGELADLKNAGYIRNIGLTEIDSETLRRAEKVHHIHTVEAEYSLIDRSIETSIVPVADELGINVLAFGALGHGLLNERILTSGDAPTASPMGGPMLNAENLPKNLPLVRALKEIADKKNVSLSQLMTAWVLTKCPKIMCLIGTASPEHLQQNIDALNINLTSEDMNEIENIASSHKVYGNDMRKLRFANGLPIFA
ncbi:MAG: aldo/keto reductase [Synergistaceae bacterium]|nr:aldo/keto reductase [Synergistaceae bacterium]MBQ3449142.1 aldo/keto reductase [Synergistaceae bacterium]MBQ3694830.1 aldo/keto reductase [Synergistaceae bacterium]MBQ9628898.1 aldo/keto reductase [Synergistaceae bacterium]MBR0069367.1 aldo/keto reductase [Synergistaceae bacterium]